MDPTANFRDILSALADNDLETARDLADDLRQWLRRGGFSPVGYDAKLVADTLAFLQCRFELIDIGIEHSQYFQGESAGGFDTVAVGIGNDAREAFDDALENLAQQIDGVDWSIVESQLLAEFPDLQNAELVESNSVIEHLRRENPSEWFDDEGEFVGDDCELYYHIAIRFSKGD